MKESTPEERLATEALIRGGHSFLLENEIFTDNIINDLILYGFMADNFVVDVEIYIDEKEKKIKYILYYEFFGFYWVNFKNSTKKLQDMIKIGLREYNIEVIKKRYKKKDEDNELV